MVRHRSPKPAIPGSSPGCPVPRGRARAVRPGAAATSGTSFARAAPRSEESCYEVLDETSDPRVSRSWTRGRSSGALTCAQARASASETWPAASRPPQNASSTARTSGGTPSSSSWACTFMRPENYPPRRRLTVVVQRAGGLVSVRDHERSWRHRPGATGRGLCAASRAARWSGTRARCRSARTT